MAGESVGRVPSKPRIFGGLEIAAPCIFEQKITKGAKLPEFQNIHSNLRFLCFLLFIDLSRRRYSRNSRAWNSRADINDGRLRLSRSQATRPPLQCSESLGTGRRPSLQEFERFVVASALKIMRELRIERAWHCRC